MRKGEAQAAMADLVEKWASETNEPWPPDSQHHYGFGSFGLGSKTTIMRIRNFAPCPMLIREAPTRWSIRRRGFGNRASFAPDEQRANAPSLRRMTEFLVSRRRGATRSKLKPRKRRPSSARLRESRIAEPGKMIFLIAVVGRSSSGRAELGRTAEDAEAFAYGAVDIAQETNRARSTSRKRFVCIEDGLHIVGAVTAV